MTTLPYVPHSETSRMAAAEAESSASTLRALVYRTILEAGATGCTDEELQGALSMNPSTQRPRRIELVHRRLVLDSGERRKTRAGRWATVWVVWQAEEWEQLRLL